MDWGPRARIEREASKWVVLIDSSDLDGPAAAQFRHWLAKSPDHRRAFQKASRIWSDLDQLSRLRRHPEIRALLAAADDEAAAAAAGRNRASAAGIGGHGTGLDRRAMLAGAGVGALALGAGGYLLAGAANAQSFETGVGERRDVTLKDGTTISLNADTRVEAHVSTRSRGARIARGEALFAIAGDDDAVAFEISAPGAGVEAARGQVLVKVLSNGVRISLMSGAARAYQRGFFASAAQVELSARSELEFASGAINVTNADDPLLAQRTLWREGRLVFDNTRLEEAVEDVSRQTGAQFAFDDPALAELRIGGVIDAQDLEGFLAMLRLNLAIEVQRDRGGIIVLSATTTTGL